MEYTILILLLPLASFLVLGLAGMKMRPAAAGAVGTAVLAGSQRPAIKSALAGEAAITLQKELAPLTAADAALSFSIFSHWNSSL